MSVGTNGFSQQEVVTWLLQDLEQSRILNPAWGADKEGFALSLPGVFVNNSTPLDPGQLFARNASGQMVFDLEALLAASENVDKIVSHLQVNTLGAAWSLAKFRCSVWQSFRAAQQLTYPRELLELAWEGNSAFIGQDVVFGPDVQFMSWSEIGLGLSHKIGPVSVGFAAKYLSGIGDVSTPSTFASLYTDSDIYQLRLTTDYRVNTSALLTINDQDQIEFISDPLTSVGLLNGNNGWAFDLGVAIHLSDHLTLSASAIDLGSISWDRKVENYISSGNFTFDGLQFDNLFNRDSLNFQEAVDTLEKIFEFSETSQPYSSSLPARFFAGVSFQLNENWQFGAVFHSESFREQRFSAVAVNAFWKPLHWLGVGASWTTRYNRPDQFGLQLVTTVGPLQFYALSDNALALVSAKQREVANARFGLNLVF